MPSCPTAPVPPSLLVLLLLPLAISGFVVTTCHQLPLPQLGLQARIAVAKNLQHELESLPPQQLKRQLSRKKQWLSVPDSPCDVHSKYQPDNVDDDWNNSYEQLKAFYDRHEHIRLHKSPTHKVLREWCQTQTRLASSGLLTQVQLSKLVDLGFWNNELHAQPWDHWYLEVLAFYLQHGHSIVPCTSTSYLVAQWGHLQRTSSFLSHRQKKMLWSINFVFDAQQAEFEMHYQKLLTLETEEPIISIRQWKKMQRSNPIGSASTSVASSPKISHDYATDTLLGLGSGQQERGRHQRSGRLGMRWTTSTTNHTR